MAQCVKKLINKYVCILYKWYNLMFITSIIIDQPHKLQDPFFYIYTITYNLNIFLSTKKNIQNKRQLMNKQKKNNKN